MEWPSSTDYQNALQHPKLALKGTPLEDCEVEKSKLGLPRPRTGACASVYRLTTAKGKYALRVFLGPGGDYGPGDSRQGRYEAISEYLKNQSLQSLVGFQFHPKYILVSGQQWPVVVMEWAAGQTLRRWVEERVQTNQRDALKAMAERWIKLVAELEDNRIAHGDLQHNNVMVVANDQPKLVDYDCMCVPSLVGKPSSEGGLPGYQHPDRQIGQPLTLDLDRASAWIIYVSLRALAAEPGLWTRHVEATKNEALLFEIKDLSDHKRPVWGDLLRSPDSEVAECARELQKALAGPIVQVGRLELDPFEQFRKAASARDWLQAAAVGRNLLAKTSLTIPAPLRSAIEDAKKRADCHEAVSKATAAHDPREAKKHYNPPLLRDWAPDLARLAEDLAALVPVLDDLQRLKTSTRDGRDLLARWKPHAATLAKAPEAQGPQGLAAIAERWRRRVEAADRLIQALKSANPDESAIDQAWRTVLIEGIHPDAAPHRERAELAGDRAAIKRKLDALPNRIDEATDQSLAALWAPKPFQNWTAMSAVVPRIRAAEQRAATLKTVREGLAQGGPDGDRKAAQALASLPSGYLSNPAEAAKAEAAKQRIRAREDLDAALKAPKPSDRVLAQRYDQAVKLQTAPSDSTVLARCRLAVQRRDSLQGLDALPKTLPDDEADVRWLKLWDNDGLHNGCADSDPYRPRVKLARERREDWERLEKALQQRDAEAVQEIIEQGRLNEYPPVQQRSDEISALIASGEELRKLLQALRAGNSEEVVRLLTPTFLENQGVAIEKHHKGPVEEALRAGLLQPKPRDTVSKPRDTVSKLRKIGEYPLKVTWTWPRTALPTYCLIGLDYDRPLLDHAKNQHGLRKLTLADFNNSMGAVPLTGVDSKRGRVYISVWRACRLPWGDVIGAAETLGPIPTRAPGPPPRSANEKPRFW